MTHKELFKTALITSDGRKKSSETARKDFRKKENYARKAWKTVFGKNKTKMRNDNWQKK